MRIAMLLAFTLALSGGVASASTEAQLRVDELGMPMPTPAPAKAKERNRVPPAPQVIPFQSTDTIDPRPAPVRVTTVEAPVPQKTAPAPQPGDLIPVAPLPGQPNYAPTAPFDIAPVGRGITPIVPGDAGPIAPPSLPSRPPIPIPPAMSLPLPKNAMQRQPLAWRARANELVNSLRGSKYSGVHFTHDFNATADETFTALAEACNQLSVGVVGVCVPGYQLLLHAPSQDRVLIVAASDQADSGATSLIFGLYPDSRTFKTDIISALLSKMESILNNKGML